MLIDSCGQVSVRCHAASCDGSTSDVDRLVKSNDQRRDAFVRQMTAAQTTVLGDDRDDVLTPRQRNSDAKISRVNISHTSSPWELDRMAVSKRLSRGPARQEPAGDAENVRASLRPCDFKYEFGQPETIRSARGLPPSAGCFFSGPGSLCRRLCIERPVVVLKFHSGTWIDSNSLCVLG